MALQRKSPLILQLLILCVFSFSVEATNTFFFVEPHDVKQILTYESITSATSTLICGVQDLQAGRSVAWYRNGTQISIDDRVYDNVVDSSRYRMDVFATSTWATFNLKITSSLASIDTDSGHYHCRLMTTPPLVSREARFDVFVTPRDGYLRCSIGDDPKSDQFNVNEGIQIILSCRSDPTGVPEMTTYWRGGPQGDTFNNNKTTSTEIRNGLRVVSFSWTPTNQQKGAIFICSSFHPGYKRNKTCQLGPFNVLYRPIVKLSPSSSIVTMETQVVIFTCITDANPPATRYAWGNTAGEKFGLQNDNVIVGPGGIWMQMKNFKREDNGVYYVTCYAENEIVDLW
ncbi:kin of IRRE-like protein 1 [Ptychodera flava]|uniref:kin of IRRE-like protein 1 n=1 Tax=Ptychodera flava TaxID=63121 RepID=UPI003969F6BD